jgi:hypothetical protein
MRLAERCTERARATTSHKPRRHSNQSTLPTRRRSPRVPCVDPCARSVDICASHDPASSGARIARARPSFHAVAPGFLWITAATLATRSGLATPILPKRRGAPASRYVSNSETIWDEHSSSRTEKPRAVSLRILGVLESVTILGSRCSISQLALVDYASLQRNALGLGDENGSLSQYRGPSVPSAPSIVRGRPLRTSRPRDAAGCLRLGSSLR